MKTIIVLAITTLIVIGCSSPTPADPTPLDPRHQPMTIDIYEPPNWGGCHEGFVVLNDTTYPTGDLTANIHVYGFTATKQVVCDIIDDQEGMWVESGGIQRFYTNEGTFLSHRKGE